MIPSTSGSALSPLDSVVQRSGVGVDVDVPAVDAEPVTVPLFHLDVRRRPGVGAHVDRRKRRAVAVSGGLVDVIP
jgi:hypothetical protein